MSSIKKEMQILSRLNRKGSLFDEGINYINILQGAFIWGYTKTLFMKLQKKKIYMMVKKYTCYGIVALIILNNTKTKIDEILDISTDFKFVKKLVDDFNNYDLHIEHFYDVVYDSLCAEFTV